MGRRAKASSFWLLVLLVSVSMTRTGPCWAQQTGMAALGAGVAAADDTEEKATPLATDDSDWRVITGMGIWAMSATGSVRVAGRTTDVDAQFSDLLDHLQMAAMPSVEVGIKKWSFVFNGMFARLEAEKNNTPLAGDVDVTSDMIVADLAVAYRVWDIPLQGEESDDRVLTIEPAVGVRYTFLSVEVDTQTLGDADGDKDWWDPYIGGRATLKISEKLSWRSHGSVGGFGVGSDFAWSAGTFLDWQAFTRMGFNVGYQALGWQLEDGDFAWDMIFHGPWIGMRMTW